jgi:hypothetical protein
MQFDVLKKINQCSYTSLESEVSEFNFGELVVKHFVDTVARNRFVVESAGNVVAAILFDEDKTCMFRETSEEFRRQGLQSNLWMYAASVLGNIKHSEDLTDLGKLAAKC